MQPRDHRRIVIEVLALATLGTPLGRRIGGGEQVLGAVRNAMQRTAPVAARDLVRGLPRFGARAFGHGVRDAIELRAVAVDALEIALGEIDRRQLARADQLRQFIDGLEQRGVIDLAHRAPPPAARLGALDGVNTNAISLPAGSS